MNRTLRAIGFWSFQIINTLTGFLMTFFPKEFHESLFRNPQAVYAQLGFSPVAVEMTHNIIRGQGAVLLAVSIFLWIKGRKSNSAHLLNSLVCLLSAYAQAMTLVHHLKTTAVGTAISSFEGLYITLVITAFVGVLNAIVYFRSKQPG
jgi:hypothetical protein